MTVWFKMHLCCHDFNTIYSLPTLKNIIHINVSFPYYASAWVGWWYLTNTLGQNSECIYRYFRIIFIWRIISHYTSSLTSHKMLQMFLVVCFAYKSLKPDIFLWHFHRTLALKNYPISVRVLIVNLYNEWYMVHTTIIFSLNVTFNIFRLTELREVHTLPFLWLPACFLLQWAPSEKGFPLKRNKLHPKELFVSF